LGGVFALVYGAAIVLETILTGPFTARKFLVHSLAAIPVLGAVGWCIANQMFEGAGAALHVGIAGPARHEPIWTLVVGIGPLLIAALLGLWPIRGFPSAAVPAALAALVGLWLMYFVLLVPDQYWVGFRAGQILLVTLPLFAARFFHHALSARVRWLRWPGIALVVLLFTAGLPTTLVDTFTAQDIANERMGPGFHWTIHLTPQEQEALTWIRHETPSTAIVQMDAVTRGRETWTLIPTFAGRRMAAGLYPVSLVDVALYDERAKQVHTLYESESAAQAWSIASMLGIDYVYLDAVEKAAFTRRAVEKFEHNTQYFVPVFRNAEVVVFSVVRRTDTSPAAASPTATPHHVQRPT
jgi:uncharacterized membrane protein